MQRVTGTSAELHLSIQIDSDPIAGSANGGTGEPQLFCGWMELVAVIEAARLGAERASGTASDMELGGSRGGLERGRQAPGAILG
jgi:hypothetical protein